MLQLNETSKKHLQETGYVEVNSGQIEHQLKWLEERTKDLRNAEDFISQVSLSFENHSAAEISRNLQALADAKSSFRELGEINSVLHGFEQRIGCGRMAQESNHRRETDRKFARSRTLNSSPRRYQTRHLRYINSTVKT